MKPYYDSGGITLYLGDCLEVLPQLSVVDIEERYCELAVSLLAQEVLL